MHIDAAALSSLLERATASHDEVCGVLLGQRGPARVVHAVHGRNLDPSPRRRYLLDAATLLHAEARARAAGLAIVGFYHSHPAGPAVPSPADRGTMWAGHVYLIIALSGATAYACAWIDHGYGLSAEPIHQ